ncbi:hypothetical protein FHL15_005341 [Xylaria flabelliformis]|uniref:Uncharacterized protein n=1 Tax=Xylaria flabelliformis TaxID=2512241 RepID=A0A553I0G0_9PEZI|nr:hypothetical protein FHL15_005341 [Xylaria flabelliformis]
MRPAVQGSHVKAVTISGFEVVGIILGAIPLLVSALEHYGRGIKTIQIVWRWAKVMRSLATALNTEQTILRNTCETWLGGINPKDMKPLLAEPFGPPWQDPYIKLETSLDFSTEKSKQVIFDDGSIGKRDMIKIALQFSTHEDSLKRLGDINQKLDLMITGNLRNEPYREPVLYLYSIAWHKPQDAKRKAQSSWVWDEIVLRLAETPTKALITAISLAPTDVVIKKSRFVCVKFLDNDTNTSIVRASSPLDGSESTTA